MKILVVGSVEGAYRHENFVKTVLERGDRVSLLDPKFVLDGSRFWIGGVVRRALVMLEVLFRSAFADVIWVLGMNGRIMPAVALARVLFRRPVIAELYTSLYDTGRDRGWYRSARSLSAAWHRVLDRMVIQSADVLVHLSRHELEYIVSLVKARPPRCVEIVPLAVEERAIAQSDAASPFRICWFGSFIPLHGIERVLTAISILVSRGVDVRLDMFGPDSPEARRWRSRILELALDSRCSVNVDQWFPKSPPADVVSRYHLALGVFGESEKMQHVFPNKVVDAFASRLPVLTSDTPALPEFVDTERHLFSCSPTPEAIAEAIEMITRAPAERDRRAAEGHALYRTRFTMQRYAADIRRILDEVTVRVRS